LLVNNAPSSTLSKSFSVCQYRASGAFLSGFIAGQDERCGGSRFRGPVFGKTAML
jgi:hypothetical protein